MSNDEMFQDVLRMNYSDDVVRLLSQETVTPAVLKLNTATEYSINAAHYTGTIDVYSSRHSLLF